MFILDILETIKSRRTIGKVKPDLVPTETIEKILEAGNWAPSHFRTEPWKFFVLTGEGRKPLGRVLAEIAKEKMDDPTTEDNKHKLKKQERKPFRAPVVIAVAAIIHDHPKALINEEVAAVNAAVQNMLLAAHGLGLGAIWRTGKPTYHSKMKQAFGLAGQDQMIGFIYLGYPDIEPKPVRKYSFKEKTTWFSEDIPYHP